MVAKTPVAYTGSLLSAQIVVTVVADAQVIGTSDPPRLQSERRKAGGMVPPRQHRGTGQGSRCELSQSLHCCSGHTCCVAPCLSLVCADVRPASSPQAEFSRPLNPFLYPTEQLRGPPVLPEQSVSIEELQGQLAQATRLHREETEKFTNKMRKVNM